MPVETNKSEIIQELQSKILAMQGFSRPVGDKTIRTGLGAIERAFPNQVFPTGAIHEFISDEAINTAATIGFLAGLISSMMQSKGVCLWVSTKRHVFPLALKSFGINPEQIIFIDATRDKEALWIVEEGLKCKSLAVVIGELNALDFTASRRLQLAVERSRVTGFIHRSNIKTENNVACVSRWHITPLHSVQKSDAPGIGFPKWNVQLDKVRNGTPGTWQIEWTSKGFKELPAIGWTQSKAIISKTG